MSSFRILAFTLVMAMCWTATTAHATPKSHYTLQRDVYRLEMRKTPIVRVYCTMRDSETGQTDTVIWDPEEKTSNVRYALLPKRSKTLPTRQVICRSEHKVTHGGDLPEAIIFYEAAPASVGDSDPATVTFATKALSGTVVATLETDALSIDVAVTSYGERERFLQQRNSGSQTSRLRSLDPTATIVNDAFTALTTVALDRAQAAGKEFARMLIRRALCEELTVGMVRKKLTQTNLAAS